MKSKKQDNWLNFSQLKKENFIYQYIGFTVLSSLVAHPLSVIAIKQQAGDNNSNCFKQKTVIQSFEHSWKSAGFRSLYRGWMPLNILGVPSGLAFIAVMEASRELLQDQLRSAFPNWSCYSVDLVQSIASSALANLIALPLAVPGRVIASKLIIQPNGISIGTQMMIHKVVTEHGMRGLFLGLCPSLIVGVVTSAQWWFAYSSCKRLALSLPQYEKYRVGYDCMSGLVAGLSATFVAHPFDTIKTIIMTTDGDTGITRKIHNTAQSVNSRVFKHFLPTLIHTVKTEGVLRLYRGLPAVLYQTAVGSSIFVMGYEFIKRKSAVGMGVDCKTQQL